VIRSLTPGQSAHSVTTFWRRPCARVTWDLPRLEARLVASERRRIAAERDRHTEKARRYLQRIDQINAQYAPDPDRVPRAY